MAEINLLKNELRDDSGFASGNTAVRVFYFVLAVFVILVVVYLGLVIYSGSLQGQINDIEQEAVDVQLGIQAVEPELDKVVSVQQRLSNLDALLGNHLHWSGFFAELEDFTLSQAQFNNMQVQLTDSEAIINGVLPSYTDIGKLITGLERSQYVEEVSLESTGTSTNELSGFTFNITVTFDQEIFNQQGL